MRVGNGLVKLVGLCLLAGVLVAGMLFPTVGALGVVSNRASDTVDATSADLVTTDPPLMSVVEDKNGKPIAYLYQQYRVNTPSDQISDVMKAAIVAIEDRRFYQHDGVDWQGTFRALLSNQVNGSVSQGASTITQQYVKNYQVLVAGRDDKSAQEQAQAQTVARKLKEARVALQLEKKLSKDEILTRYLNLVTFLGRVDGIGTASQVFFNTTPKNLTLSQAALLAGVVNNPVSFDPWQHPAAAKKRRDTVIDAMVTTGKITTDNAEAAKKADLGVGPEPQLPGSGCVGTAPEVGFYCDYVLGYLQEAGFNSDQLQTGGYVIKTNLDPDISKIAKAAAEKNVPKTANGIANTFVIIKPGSQSHDIAALVANRDLGVDSAQGQTLTNLPADVSDNFGAGSIYKIFTTAAAMEKGQVGLNTGIPNPKTFCFFPPIRYPETKCHTVANDDATNPDPITLHEALAISPNTSFTNVEIGATMPSVLDMASRLGMRNTMKTNQAGGKPDPNGANELTTQPQSQSMQNNLSFTLGVTPLSPLELANVGATLASGGVWCEPNPIAAVTDHTGKAVPLNTPPCEQVVNKAVADTIVNGLKDDTISGTSVAAARNAHWTRPMAGKTGTTETSRSVGFLGILPNWSASSMVFADGSTPEPICGTLPVHSSPNCAGANGAFGGTVAAPTWFNAFTQIVGNSPVLPLPNADPAYMDKKDHGPAIPYVVGKNVGDATNALKGAGYNIVQTADFNSIAPKGTVVGQTPIGSAPHSQSITLYVSTGFVPQAPGATSPAPTTGGTPGG
ncbi:transglycosylase domain-containing protein [Kutzneria chonburiensis]|uniref:Transglycosylase domain-containing protein n=1 Tax=Kutzneria chonburiensis TaxID=1483604 RepID=A0ABV6N255_9PSEU|nr:transglycosylase domain-containing protein [Kutzneria chonburiensis]